MPVVVSRTIPEKGPCACQSIPGSLHSFSRWCFRVHSAGVAGALPWWPNHERPLWNPEGSQVVDKRLCHLLTSVQNYGNRFRVDSQGSFRALIPASQLIYMRVQVSVWGDDALAHVLFDPTASRWANPFVHRLAPPTGRSRADGAAINHPTATHHDSKIYEIELHVVQRSLPRMTSCKCSYFHIFPHE